MVSAVIELGYSGGSFECGPHYFDMCVGWQLGTDASTLLPTYTATYIVQHRRRMKTSTTLQWKPQMQLRVKLVLVSYAFQYNAQQRSRKFLKYHMSINMPYLSGVTKNDVNISGLWYQYYGGRKQISYKFLSSKNKICAMYVIFLGDNSCALCFKLGQGGDLSFTQQ